MKLDRLKASLRETEGVIPHFYLDTKGFVTAGIGHLLRTEDEAFALPWTKDDRPASTAEIRFEYQRVKALKPGMGPRYYAERTTLRLSDEAMDRLLDADVDAKASEVAASLPGFDAFPDGPQCGCLDIAFNCGVNGPTGLIHGFPRMMAYVKAGRWVEASRESHRPEVSDKRNRQTAAWFAEAAKA